MFVFRYVDIEKLQAVWWEEGIEDTEQILKDLGITCGEGLYCTLSVSFIKERVAKPACYVICCSALLLNLHFNDSILPTFELH